MNTTLEKFDVEDMIEKLEALADPEVFNADGFHLGIKGNSLSVEKEIGRIFYDLVLKNKPKRIIEFGTAHGYSTCWFLLGLIKNKSGEIITIDRYDRSPKIWNEIRISTLRLETRLSETNDFIHSYQGSCDMLFLDTDHRVELIISDLEKMIPFLEKGAVVFVHDTNYCPQMGVELKEYFGNRKDFEYIEMSKSCGLGIATYKGDIRDTVHH
jgi:predicted O-methyltransferase YrrM